MKKSKVKSYETERLITNVFIANGEKSVGRIEIQDPRIKEISLLEIDFKKSDKHMAFELQEISSLTTDTFRMVFLTPNNISILLHVYRDQLKKYKLTLLNHVLKNDLGEQYSKENKLTFTSKMVYEMIQYAEGAIVFGYTALEAFVNGCIPDGYIYETLNNKGVIERYDVKAIERWLTLSDKLTKVLGEVFNDKELVNQPFWSDFKETEVIRNSIIHMKKENSEFFHVFFQESTIRKIESIESIINYFVSIGGDFPFPLSDFHGAIRISKSNVPASEVKNMEVNFLARIDSGKTIKLKDLLDEYKEKQQEG